MRQNVWAVPVSAMTHGASPTPTLAPAAPDRGGWTAEAAWPAGRGRSCRRRAGRSGRSPRLSCTPVSDDGVDALLQLLEATAREVGAAFFPALVRQLAALLGVAHVLVAELCP